MRAPCPSVCEVTASEGDEQVKGGQEGELPPELALRPIGTVRNSVTDRSTVKGDEWEGVESELIVDPDLAPGLDGLEGFSHIVVIFWMHQSPPFSSSRLKVHPRGDESRPLTGVFATRSPVRPNSLGLSTVRLVERMGNVLRVQGLDAINGTPIVDIKPYLPHDDNVSGVKAADWLQGQPRL